MPAPSVIVFDVNETLSDLEPMAQRFTDIGLHAQLATTWFAQVLRDGFALAAAGSSGTFATIAEGVLHSMFVQHAPNRNPDAAVQHVLDGFSSLHVHPDVPTGVRALAASGLRLVTLTNGATSVGDALLANAGVRDRAVPAIPHQTRHHRPRRRRPGAHPRQVPAHRPLTHWPPPPD